MASVQISNVRKVYGNDVVALHDITLTIEDGEFFVLVGPSGCGKSTLLRMIAGLEEISAGDIFIGDTRINDIPPKNRDVAMVFQNYALYPHMTVFENMSFALKHKKVPKAEIRERVEEAARILELDELLQRKPHALSGGQRQRVAVGRAMVRNPNVFLFDEPLSNLDAKLRMQMRVEISRLHKQLQTTIIYVTHDQVEAMTMGSRIVVLQEGRLQQVDTPYNLYRRPANLFVAGFIGSPAMNFFSGGLSGDSGAFAAGEAQLALPAEVAAALAKLPGGKGTIGVRPEHIYPAGSRNGEPDDAIYKVTVDVLEPVGSDAYVYFDLGGCHCCMRVDPSQGLEAFAAGNTIQVAFDQRHISLFHPESGADSGPDSGLRVPTGEEG